MHVTYIDVPERVSPQIAPRLGGTRARDGRASTESDRFTRRRGETNRYYYRYTRGIITLFSSLLLPTFSLLFSLFRNTHESHVLGVSIRGCCRCRFEPISANHRCRLHSGEGGGRQGADRGKARSRFRSTHVARKGRIYHTRGLVIMAIVIIIIIIIIIIVIIPKGVIRYRDS